MDDGGVGTGSEVGTRRGPGVGEVSEGKDGGEGETDPNTPVDVTWTETTREGGVRDGTKSHPGLCPVRGETWSHRGRHVTLGPVSNTPRLELQDQRSPTSENKRCSTKHFEKWGRSHLTSDSGFVNIGTVDE